MYNKITLIIFIIFTSFVFIKQKQIYIPQVGNNWKLKVDSAINLIHKIDTNKYNILMDNCDSIDFSTAAFSTTIPPKIIVISNKDMELNSINNIAAVLVHESNHLYYFNTHANLGSDEEELGCYFYEYDFLSKLPEVEDWLFINNVNKIIYYQNRLKQR